MPRFFFSIIGDVCDLIAFFIPENSSCYEEAFVHGGYTHHDTLSNYILFITNFLDVTSSILYLYLKPCDDVIDNGTYIPDVILKEVKLFMLLTRLS